MTEPKTAPISDTDNLTQQIKFESLPTKAQLQALPELVSAGESGLKVLMEFLLNHSSPVNWVSFKAYEAFSINYKV